MFVFRPTFMPRQSGQILRKMSSLCFYDAALKRSKKEIEEEVYLEMLASHCRGERHGINKQCDGDSKHDGKEILDYMARLRGLDDTAYTFQYWILDQEPVKGELLRKPKAYITAHA